MTRLAIVPQRPFDARKREFAPRDLVPGKKFDLKAFHAGRKMGLREPGAVHQLNLADMSDAIDRQQRVERNVRAGFFQGFATGAVLRRFVLFQKTCRQCPQAYSWFDGAATQQDAVVMHDDRPDDNLGVRIMDMPASSADVAFRRISFGYATFEVRTGRWRNGSARMGH
jgi:hypothetical protein